MLYKCYLIKKTPESSQKPHGGRDEGPPLTNEETVSWDLCASRVPQPAHGSLQILQLGGLTLVFASTPSIMLQLTDLVTRRQMVFLLERGHCAFCSLSVRQPQHYPFKLLTF